MPKEKKECMELVSFYLPKETKEKLDKISEQSEVKISALIRLAIKELLSKEGINIVLS